MSQLIVRPLSDFPGAETPADDRIPARFIRPSRRGSNGTWESGGKTSIEQTREELRHELDRIAVETAVLELDVPATALRRDGFAYADAKARSPRVVLSFDHPQQGPTRMPADRFTDWRDNVRAIRLALEALRAIDRYGITRKAEQYRGWAALPAESSATLNAAAAVRILMAYQPATAGLDSREADTLVPPTLLSEKATRALIRAASVATHPDTAGGDTARFQAVQQARAVLAAHFGVSTL